MNIYVSAAGTLECDNSTYRCALGRSGMVLDKHEGDGGIPQGIFPLRQVFYRADKLSKPATALTVVEIQENDGWCDDPTDDSYNKLITLPHPARHEVLWRTDDTYDVLVPFGYNDDPIVPGRGSALFIHVAREDYSPTEGCVALSLPDLLQVLQKVSADTHIHIGV